MKRIVVRDYFARSWFEAANKLVKQWLLERRHATTETFTDELRTTTTTPMDKVEIIGNVSYVGAGIYRTTLRESDQPIYIDGNISRDSDTKSWSTLVGTGRSSMRRTVIHNVTVTDWSAMVNDFVTQWLKNERADDDDDGGDTTTTVDTTTTTTTPLVDDDVTNDDTMNDSTPNERSIVEEERKDTRFERLHRRRRHHHHHHHRAANAATTSKTIRLRLNDDDEEASVERLTTTNERVISSIVHVDRGVMMVTLVDGFNDDQLIISNFSYSRANRTWTVLVGRDRSTMRRVAMSDTRVIGWFNTVNEIVRRWLSDETTTTVNDGRGGMLRNERSTMDDDDAYPETNDE